MECSWVPGAGLQESWELQGDEPFGLNAVAGVGTDQPKKRIAMARVPASTLTRKQIAEYWVELFAQRQRHVHDSVEAFHFHGQSAAGKDGEHCLVAGQYLRLEPC